MQVSGELGLSPYGQGDQMLSSVHKRVHPYPVSEPGRVLLMNATSCFHCE